MHERLNKQLRDGVRKKQGVKTERLHTGESINIIHLT